MVKKEKGFTLVELLVVITIIGILVAVAIPSFIGMTSQAKAKAKEAELSLIQTAMDAMMAMEDISTVTAESSVNDFTNKPDGHPLYPDCLRKPVSHGTYSWTDKGIVSTVEYP